MSDIELSNHLIAALRNAPRITVLTGAGVSAESGIPTFRQAQTGLWAQYDPEELATPHAFRRDPGLVWRWYQWRNELVSRAAPNPGHTALARMQSVANHVSLITQNVDGLHQEAGSKDVIELHGNLRRNKCFENAHVVAAEEQISPSKPGEPPRCPHCNSYLRPDVVWFGEALPLDALATAYAAAQHCAVLIAVGTSALVHPAASLPIVALQHGATLLEVNPQETALSSYTHFHLQAPAGEILPRLVAAAWPTA